MPTKLWVLEASRSEMMVIKDEVKEKPTKAWVNEQFGKLSGNITKGYIFSCKTTCNSTTNKINRIRNSVEEQQTVSDTPNHSKPQVELVGVGNLFLEAAPAAPLAPPTGELEAKAACYHEVLKLEEKLEQKENETGVGDA
eukprot:272666-Amphidinium_carterae.1